MLVQTLPIQEVPPGGHGCERWGGCRGVVTPPPLFNSYHHFTVIAGASCASIHTRASQSHVHLQNWPWSSDGSENRAWSAMERTVYLLSRSSICVHACSKFARVLLTDRWTENHSERVSKTAKSPYLVPNNICAAGSETTDDPLINLLMRKERSFYVLLTSLSTPLHASIDDALNLSSRLFDTVDMVGSIFGLHICAARKKHDFLLICCAFFQYANSTMGPSDQHNFSTWRAKILSSIAEWAKSFEVRGWSFKEKRQRISCVWTSQNKSDIWKGGNNTSRNGNK